MYMMKAASMNAYTKVPSQKPPALFATVLPAILRCRCDALRAVVRSLLSEAAARTAEGGAVVSAAPPRWAHNANCATPHAPPGAMASAGGDEGLHPAHVQERETAREQNLQLAATVRHCGIVA
jgi:hypothetical protein